MKFSNLKKTAVIIASVALSTSAYAYNQENAKRACINQVTEHGTGVYHNASGIRISDQGHHSYTVTGNVISNRDKHTHNFTCSIRHKELVSYNVSQSGNNSSGNKAVAIGAGILALAVIAAASNDKHQGHDTGSSAFDDMQYLKRQCKQNVHHHIQADHPRRHIDKIKFDNTHLNGRKLQGSGYVVFGNGNERDLTYSCEFDRRGQIYDGYYRYR